jgi:hypothetical protein
MLQGCYFLFEWLIVRHDKILDVKKPVSDPKPKLASTLMGDKPLLPSGKLKSYPIWCTLPAT